MSIIKDGILQVSDIYGTPFVVDLIPASNPYRRISTSTVKDWITAHNTGNGSPGANEYMHTQYVDENIGYINWHFTVGAKTIYQELPIHEAAYHAGDGGMGNGNRLSIGVEICEVGGDWTTIRQNAIKLFTFLMLNVPSLVGDDWYKTVVPHQKWSGKYCPRIILSEPGGFKKFQDDGYAFYMSKKNQPVTPAEPVYTWVEIGKLEKKIDYNMTDSYWIAKLNNGTLSKADVQWLLKRITRETQPDLVVNKMYAMKLITTPEYWTNVMNGTVLYNRVFLNTVISRYLAQ